MPFPSDYNFNIRIESRDLAAQRLNLVLKRLDLRWQYQASLDTGIGAANGNVWSRAARRKRDRIGEGNSTTEDEEDEKEPALAFRIQVRPAATDELEVQIRWLQGEDSVLFESFCGMLKRPMAIQ